MHTPHVVSAYVAPVACIPAWPVKRPLPTAPPVSTYAPPLPPVQAAYDPLRSRSYASCNAAHARLPGLQRPSPCARPVRYATKHCRCKGCTMPAVWLHSYCQGHIAYSYGCVAHDKRNCREC